MKLTTINAIRGILSGVKINKIPAPEERDGVNSIYLACCRAMRPFFADRDELLKKFRNDWGEDIAGIAKNDGLPHEEYFKAEAEFNASVYQMLEDGTADVTFRKVRADSLLDPILWGGDITLGEMEANVAFLVENGAAEYE